MPAIKPPTDIEPIRTETHEETLARQKKPESLIRVSVQDALDTLRKMQAGLLKK